jgi:hypothetical protein
MSYDFRTAASEAVYKGKPLKNTGLDGWVLEGRGVRVICEGGPLRGWSARLEFDDEAGLKKPSRGTAHGRDLGQVIDQLLEAEELRIKGSRRVLDDREQSLKSLG